MPHDPARRRPVRSDAPPASPDGSSSLAPQQRPGAINDMVVRVSNGESYHVVGWTVDSRDWTDDITADAIYQRVVEHVCPGAIIAFHDVNPANAAALPRLLDYLEGNGYQFVTVCEIMSTSRSVDR